MKHALRDSIRRSFAITLIVAAVGAGFVVHGSTASPSRHAVRATAPKRLDAADLLRAAATATAGIYLQFDGVTDPPSTSHSKHIPITSFQFGVARSASISGGNRTVTKPSVSEITVTHQSDKYSAPLLDQSLRGAGTGNAVLYFTNLTGGGKLIDLLTFQLGGALVTSFSTSSGGEVPSESFSLSFTSITMTARFTTPAQTVSYDLLSET